MIYRDFQGIKLPMMGMGMMRLPVIDDDYAKIDEPQTEKMIAYAMDHGVNYFDTAWGYHSGNSETVAGKLLSKYSRDSFYLASKFPGYDLKNMDKVEGIFTEQLEKCQVEYFDFYLFHNVCEMNIDDYLDRSHGIYDYLMEQKEAGRIKHLGFSAHGSYETMKRFLEAYGESMEFCQLQINWIDWTFQNAREKVELLMEYGIPVWVMEPVRGGKLASLPKKDEALLKSLRPDESIPAWSFRFVQSLPDITIILAGSSSYDQMVENITTFEKEKPLNTEELTALQSIADSMMDGTTLPCTECRYCVDHCPQELDIPLLIDLYNQRNFTGESDFVAPMMLGTMREDKQPSACIGCGSCEEVCPQQLDISGALADLAKMVAKDEE